MNAVESMKARRLVRYAYEIYDLKPWDHQDKIGIISIQLNNRKTPYFVVFLESSIVVLPNVAALVGLFMNASFEEMPAIQGLRYQQHLLCSFVSQEDADEASLELFTQSEATLRDDILPFFESTMPTLLPDMIVKKEIDVLVDVYAQVIGAVKAILEQNESIDLEEKMHYWSFDYDQKQWVLSNKDLPSSSIEVQEVQIDEKIKSDLLNIDVNHDVWEMDVAYTSIMLEQQEHHRQHAIRLCMITHHEAPLIYSQALVNQENAHEQLLQELINNIKQRGRPSKIITRDHILVDSFKTVCESLQIEIEANEVLETIDLFVLELEENMR
jgi:hypothetical protein